MVSGSSLSAQTFFLTALQPRMPIASLLSPLPTRLRRLRALVRPLLGFGVAQDVDDDTVGIDNEKPPDAPRLVGQRVDDFQISLDGDLVYVIHVVDLNRHLRMKSARLGASHHRYLSGRIRWGYERDHPIHVHSNLKSEKTRVEIPTFLDTIRFDVRYDSYDVHDPSRKLHSCRAQQY